MQEYLAEASVNRQRMSCPQIAQCAHSTHAEAQTTKLSLSTASWPPSLSPFEEGATASRFVARCFAASHKPRAHCLKAPCRVHEPFVSRRQSSFCSYLPVPGAREEDADCAKAVPDPEMQRIGLQWIEADL